MPADEREEKEPQSSKRKRTEDPGEKHQVTKDAKVTKDDKVAEVPMQRRGWSERYPKMKMRAKPADMYH